MRDANEKISRRITHGAERRAGFWPPIFFLGNWPWPPSYGVDVDDHPVAPACDGIRVYTAGSRDPVWRLARPEGATG